MVQFMQFDYTVIYMDTSVWCINYQEGKVLRLLVAPTWFVNM